jgi:hypothetical protein
MKRLTMAIGMACLFVTSATRAEAPEMPELPKPQKEHAWLEQFTGEWDSEMLAKPPGQEVVKIKGEEHSRMLGGFWLMGENKSEMFGMPYIGIMTLGYDAKTKKYIGTWVDSMGDTLWKYTGTAEGNKLTLETKGPCPLKPPGTMVNFRETLELKDKDHKVFTSSIQEDDGSWTQMMTINYTRKKK